jgi:hypothetical protein
METESMHKNFEMDQIAACTHQICELPKTFELGEKSASEIVRDAGYTKLKDRIGATEIYVTLNNDPDLVERWMHYSEDKRTTGWAFLKTKGGSFAVQFYNEKMILMNEKIFEDKTRACADFIKCEIDSIDGNVK